MTDNRCVCSRCLHPSCPLPYAEPPYDEVAHEIDNNFISVKIPKNRGKFEPEGTQQQQDKSSFDFNCADSEGEKCKPGCTKVHVIPNQNPPAKKPEEEILSLKAIRHIMPNDNLKNTLEIEFKAPRNYIPLPELGPTPPIIVPKQPIWRRGKATRKRNKDVYLRGTCGCNIGGQGTMQMQGKWNNRVRRKFHGNSAITMSEHDVSQWIRNILREQSESNPCKSWQRQIQ